MTVTRGKYAGVLSILQYNWHFYAASLCALVGIGAATVPAPTTLEGEAVLRRGHSYGVLVSQLSACVLLRLWL